VLRVAVAALCAVRMLQGCLRCSTLATQVEGEPAPAEEVEPPPAKKAKKATKPKKGTS
jgi:hypothetical protein